MIQIRHGVFETNSSSIHSVSILGRQGSSIANSGLEMEEDYVIGHFENFGWEEHYYTDAQTKLDYILTMIAENSESITEFLNSEDFNKVDNLIQEVMNCDGILIHDWEYATRQCSDGSTYFDIDGYIDHQSMYKCIDDFLDNYGIGLEEFIFDEGIELVTDNDNH